MRKLSLAILVALSTVLALAIPATASANPMPWDKPGNTVTYSVSADVPSMQVTVYYYDDGKRKWMGSHPTPTSFTVTSRAPYGIRATANPDTNYRDPKGRPRWDSPVLTCTTKVHGGASVTNSGTGSVDCNIGF